MNTLMRRSLVLAASVLFVVLACGSAMCWNYPPMPAMPYPAPSPFGVPSFPENGALMQGPGFPMQANAPMMGCGPTPGCGPSCKLEVGSTGYYSTNDVTLSVNNEGTIDFIKDLNFLRHSLVGDIYVSVRLPPVAALTYTYMFPREDHGYGILAAPLTVGNTTFAAGTHVAGKSLTSLHRWEGVYYGVQGCKMRAGGLLMAELCVETLEMHDDATRAKETYSEFLLGVGAEGEYAAAPNLFLKGKGAYTFLQNQDGVLLDGQARWFCDLFGGSTCGPAAPQSSCRPYVAAGYRYRYSRWDRENSEFKFISHGPYFAFGVVF